MLQSEAVAKSQVTDDRRRNYKEIDEWGVQEKQKAPQLTIGEMSYPEAKVLKALRLKLADRFVALADQELRTTRKQWQVGEESWGHWSLERLSDQFRSRVKTYPALS